MNDFNSPASASPTTSRRASRSFIKLALLAMAAGTSIACGGGVTGSGDIEEREEDVSEFDSIVVNNSFEATVVMGDEFGVVVRADDNLIDDVIVTQLGDKVSVTFDQNDVGKATLEVEFTLPELKSIALNDASLLTATNTMLSDEVNITVSDASSISLSAQADELVSELTLLCQNASDCELDLLATNASVRVKDSSFTTLKGEGTDLELTISDSGNGTATNFMVETAKVDLSDSSTGSVYALESVTGAVTDSSSLNVRGGANVQVDVSDDSTVIKE